MMKVVICVVAVTLAACAHHDDKEAKLSADSRNRNTSAHALQGHEGDAQMSGDDRPLSGSWDGMLVEGGAQRLQDALADKGFYEHKEKKGKLDAETREALRRFQKSQNIPATGLPDHQTVSALGLDQADVFRSGSKKDNDSK